MKTFKVHEMATIFVIALTVAFVATQPAQAASIKGHALVKIAKAAIMAPAKGVETVAAHPKRDLKATIGSIVFAAESVVDVAHFTLAALDAGAAAEFQALHYPIHPLAVFAAKADAELERAEQFFFGTSN